METMIDIKFMTLVLFFVKVPFAFALACIIWGVFIFGISMFFVTLPELMKVITGAMA